MDLKNLSLSLFVIVALTLITAPSAMATSARFKAGSGAGTANISLEQDPNAASGPAINTLGGPIQCEKFSANYNGAAESSDVTLTGVNYGTCVLVNFGWAMESKFNGCAYEFHAGTPNSLGSEGSVDLQCPPGQRVEFISQSTPCTFSVWPQNGLGVVRYEQVHTAGKPPELTFELNLTNTEYEYSGWCGKGSENSGTLESKATVRATDTKENALDLRVTPPPAGIYFKSGTGSGTSEVTLEADPSIPTQLIETDVGPIECQEVAGAYEGDASSEILTLNSVAYSGECNVAGLEAEVKMNGCEYGFFIGSKTEGGSTGTYSVECHVGKSIEVIAAGGLCTVEVGSQTNIGPVKYTNVQTGGKNKELTVHVEASKISYSWTGPLCGSGENSNGTYQGTLTARATDTSSNPLDLTAA